jgi:hypothetical protein
MGRTVVDPLTLMDRGVAEVVVGDGLVVVGVVGDGLVVVGVVGDGADVVAAVVGEPVSRSAEIAPARTMATIISPIVVAFIFLPVDI